MKDEIKEILKLDEQLLDKIEHILGSELSSEEYDKFYNYFNEIRKPNILVDIKDVDSVKDYITNLQTIEKQYSAILSENAELENKITNLQEENKFAKEYEKQYRIAKSRNEKAIEYFKYQLEQLDFYEDTKAKMLCAMGIVILQGEDKDE